jgi:hypothetical protein
VGEFDGGVGGGVDLAAERVAVAEGDEGLVAWLSECRRGEEEREQREQEGKEVEGDGAREGGAAAARSVRRGARRDARRGVWVCTNRFRHDPR